MIPHPAPVATLGLALALTGCVPASGTAPPAATTVPPATVAAPSISPSASPRVVIDGLAPVRTGTPIRLADLTGRIVTDDFDDVFAFDVDGSNVVTIADRPGAEFDAAWSPDGEWVVYRDSTRGLNENDELFLARADGSERRNVTNHPANDWGADWSPDGSTIVFNSDRDGGLRGYFMDPDGSNVRRVAVDQWFEYPSYSPDGARIVFESALGATYDLFVLEVATNAVTRLTETPGNDAWPAWSPDGSTIAFGSHRDDCRIAPPDEPCWRSQDEDTHDDIWLISPDGTNVRRVNGEKGQFVAWSPDGAYLLVSGRALTVVRPDGTGRLELRAEGVGHALGGIPDWR